jgi:uncharacterized membrane protein YbhN (UPF0104 family)
LPLSSAWGSGATAFAWFAAIAVVAASALAIGIWRAESLAAWTETRANSSRVWVNKALQTAGDTLRSLARLRQASLLYRVMALTAGCWVLIYLCGYVSLLGVGVRLGLWDGLFAYSFPMIASMTPFYMLGGFGVFEGSIGFGLHLVNVPLNVAVAAGVMLHVAELVFVVLPAPFGVSPRRAEPAASRP